jgi:hypothetical protein
VFCGKTGTDVMIVKNFSPKNLPKILAFFDQTIPNFCVNVIIILVLRKNAKFLAEIWQKSQKNIIITSTTGILGSLGLSIA